MLIIVSLLTDICLPTVAFALSGGPSQPEFQGFTEVGVGNMVDPFTGDFSYEIPLMTVPGPNGGYPINLNYAAGVGMEDEASWVGLGWTLNPGAINRNMRGVPDDFSGPQTDENNQTLVPNSNSDRITKSFFTKNNVTVGIGVGLNISLPEVGGADLSFVSVSPNVNLYYNTYKGVGVRPGVGIKLSTMNNEGSSGSMSAGLNMSFDSNDGASLQPSLSFSAKGEKMQTGVSIGFGYNSRQGITNTFLNTSISKSATLKDAKTYKIKTGKDKGKVTDRSDSQSSGNGVSFAATSGVPSNSMAMAGFNTGFNLDFEAGALQTNFDIPVSFNGMLSVQKVKDWMIDGYAYPAYGTMYSGYRDNESIEHGRALMDYNREKDFAINVKSPVLPMPVMTQDIYSVTGADIGGSFRAFRNDVGLFHEPRVASDFLGVTIGLEVAASTGFKIGVDPSVNFSHSYSGKWKSEDDIKQVSSNTFFRKPDHFTSGNLRSIQPFDFRFTGEMTAHSAGDNRFSMLGGAGAKHFTLFPASADFPDLSEQEYEDPDAQNAMSGFFPFDDIAKVKAKASNKLNGTPINASQTLRTQKERKVQLVEYRTKKEIQLGGITTHLPSVFVTNPALPMPSKTAFDLNQPAIKNHHISEFTVVKAGGMRYTYGLPLYNRKHEEYYFAIQKPNAHPGQQVDVADINTLVNQTRKGRAGDKFFSSTKISPYVHAHLLTQIVSPDYVDVDGNGPSDNDFGYWTKFNYNTIQNYKWRVPVKAGKANYIEGLPSNPNDDKATITYGERDMTFLHSIETKTHVAVFFLKDRLDAKDVQGVAGGLSATNQKCLDHIVLFSKSDLKTPIKSVHFEYDYSLCKESDNSNGPGQGKLTLIGLHFQYGNSTKGQLAPYSFEYAKVYKDASSGIGLEEVAATDANHKYVMNNNDRWGTYKPDGTIANQDFPYVDQRNGTAEDLQRQRNATAWNLTGITLPTGAKIKVAYEMDDYGYVQDKVATQMYKIVGTGTVDGNTQQMKTSPSSHSSITNNFRRIYFELDNSNTTDADVKKMLDQTPDAKVYFKTWQKLQVIKGLSGQWAYDYVTGYAPLLKTTGTYGVETVGGTKYGYFTLATDPSGPSGAQHFFRKAGLQYLRYQRADLDMPQNQGDAALQAASMILTGIPIIMQAMQLIKGYYGYAIGRGYCEMIGYSKPSFIKLGSADGIKYGGGHRVRKITISDAWDDLAGGNEATYGMEYFYRVNEQGGNQVSSGVASYEPLIGGDENPMKKAYYYGPDSKYVHNDPAFFVEEPFGESYFPAPIVGYSKVTTVNLANSLGTKTGDGIQVKEFYTAKDFPIKTSFTAQPQRIEDKQTIFIPLIANITFAGYGYAQGYYIELNDMHGKPKAETLHDADYWDTTSDNWKVAEPPFVSKKIYNYKSSGNSLINTVDVLDADQQVRTAIMGESSEMFSEMKEDFGYSIGAGAQINGGIDPVPMGIFFTGFPNFEYSENSARVLVTTKIVYKNGILDEVIEMAEGAVKKTRNLLYEPENGAPLLTVVTSDYDDASKNTNDQYIYNYTYPAHWYYTGMGAAYRNYRNYYSMTSSSFPNANLYFEKGDELLSDAGQRVWVANVNTVSVALVDADGDPATYPANFVTLRSGKRNQQNVPTGALASLKNPIGGYHNPLLDYFNEVIFQSTTSPFSTNLASGATATKAYPAEGIMDCALESMSYSGNIVIANSSTAPYSTPVIRFSYFEGREPCNLDIEIPSQIVSLGVNPSKMHLSYYSDTHVLITYHNSGSDIRKYPAEITGKCKTLNYCLDGILNASADEFSDHWLYNGDFDQGTTFNDLNNYLKGNRGIWRKLRTNAYFSERMQRTKQPSDNNAAIANAKNTYIGRDGTYSRFSVFRWLFDHNQDGVIDGNANNVQANKGWRWQAEVTPYGYSPYGFEIENRDALGIYSAELYGYGNSLVTAVSKNARYTEIAFDGFEESPTGTYVPHGHINLNPALQSSVQITDEHSHTGNQCLRFIPEDGWLNIAINVVGPPDQLSPNVPLQFVRGRKYILSFWYRFDNHTGQQLSVAFKKDGEWASPWPMDYAVNTSEPAIEGWRRVEVTLETEKIWQMYDPTNSIFSSAIAHIDINPHMGGRDLFIDDLRIHPADASFKSYVYDPRSYLLRSILDDNNYATFYNYDAENTLVQVKKETMLGVRTIQTTRKNVKTPNN